MKFRRNLITAFFSMVGTTCWSSEAARQRGPTSKWRNRVQTWLLCVALLPAVAQAQFTFTTNNGTITFTGYTGTNSSVVIPITTNGYPVTAIGGAFSQNSPTTLKSVTIPDSVKIIGDGAFNDCFNLTNVSMGQGVTSIGSSAFAFCGNLTGVTLPNSLTNIGGSAFWFCGLTNVTIPKSVVSLGDAALAACYSLKAITVDTKNPVFTNQAGVLFDIRQTTLLQYPGAKTGSYTIPATVTSIGDSAFSYCHNLNSISITNAITSIGKGAFYVCSPLTNVTIGDQVTNIGEAAFRACLGLTGVTMPNGVLSIGSQAFNDCTSLINITIPQSVTSIGDGAFSGCNRLTAINVNTSNAFYSSLDGVLFDINKTTLLQCPAGGAGSYTIPATVTSIGDNSFYGCTSLTNIVIRNGVTNIGYEAFSDCTNLTNVTIPKSVLKLGGWAFIYCFSLRSIFSQGDAPSLSSPGALGNNSQAIVYYLPGTENWKSLFGGLPTRLWNPQPQNDASFGVQNKRFGFNITGSGNLVIVVEGCTNLTNPIWSPISTNTLNTFIGTNGTSYFSDPQWTNYPGRFYRLRSP